MKTKILLLLLTILFESQILFAQLPFQTAIGGTNFDYGASVERTTDGGYIIVGSFEITPGNADVYLIKTNLNGDTLWTKTFGGINNDYGLTVRQTSDSGYILIENTQTITSFIGSSLIKTNANGDLSWAKAYNGIYATDVQQTTDGGYVMVGQVDSSTGFSHADFGLIKISSIGALIWSKRLYTVYEDAPYSVLQTNDGGYIISGNSGSYGAGPTDIFIVRTDSNGNVIWNKFYGTTTGFEFAYSMEQTLDGGWVLGGAVSLMKIDSTGDLTWLKQTSNSSISSVSQTSDGGYILTGWSGSTSASSKLWICKTDNIGNPTWSKIIGSINSKSSSGNSIHQTIDGGFIILGSTESFGAGNSDLYLIKTDANGNTTCFTQNMTSSLTSPVSQVGSYTLVESSTSINITSSLQSIGGGGVLTNPCTVGVNDITSDNTFYIYPNPFTNYLTLRGTSEDGSLIINDMYGRQIIKQGTTKGCTNIKTEFLKKGLYLLHYYENSKCMVFKITKE